MCVGHESSAFEILAADASATSAASVRLQWLVQWCLHLVTHLDLDVGVMRALLMQLVSFPNVELIPLVWLLCPHVPMCTGIVFLCALLYCTLLFFPKNVMYIRDRCDRSDSCMFDYDSRNALYSLGHLAVDSQCTVPFFCLVSHPLDVERHQCGRLKINPLKISREANRNI